MASSLPSTDHLALDEFIHYDPHHGKLMVEGVAAEELMRHHGTPLYCYSAGAVRKAIADYRAAFAPLPFPVAIHYAAKANSRLGLLRLIQSCGVGIDIVSIGEMVAGIEAGFKAADMIYSGAGKTNGDINWAIANHIGQLNIESFDEIAMVIAAANQQRPAQPIRVAVRVNPDIAAGGHEKISTGKAGDKSGIGLDHVVKAYQLLSVCPHLRPSVIAMHIGSQLTDGTAVERAHRRLADLIITLQQAGIAITMADVGGGMAITYSDEKPLPLKDYAAMVGRVFAPLQKIGLEKIAIEPGRSIIGRAGILLCQIVLQKNSGGRHITVVDAAMNDLIRPTLYHAYHSIMPILQAKDDIDRVKQDIVGGICESGDFLALARPLPVLRNGDGLAILQAGAYGAVMASNYNSRLTAAEVLVDGATHRLIRRRQTLDDFFMLEKNL